MWSKFLMCRVKLPIRLSKSCIRRDRVTPLARSCLHRFRKAVVVLVYSPEFPVRLTCTSRKALVKSSSRRLRLSRKSLKVLSKVPLTLATVHPLNPMVLWFRLPKPYLSDVPPFPGRRRHLLPLLEQNLTFRVRVWVTAVPRRLTSRKPLVIARFAYYRVLSVVKTIVSRSLVSYP